MTNRPGVPPVRVEDPLTRSIVRRVLIPLLVAIVVFVIPLGFLGVQDARGQVVELVERQATIVALLAGGAPETLLGPDAALDRFAGVEGEVAALLNRRGEQVAGAELSPAVRASPVVARALGGQIGSAVDATNGVVVGGAPVVIGGDVVGAAVVAVPNDAIVTRIRTTLSVIGVVTLALLAAATLAGRSLARRIVRPIEELDRVASQFADGDLSARADMRGAPPELRRLADTLHDSAQDIQRLLALQRSFVADASHQLRTPLAGLRLRLENAQMASGDPDGRLGSAIAEVDRLTSLVADLLTLARVERGDAAPVVVDVAQVVAQRADAWRPLATESAVALVTHGPASLQARCVPGGLEQIVDNLLANALRHAPEGTTIDLEVAPVAPDVASGAPDVASGAPDVASGAPDVAAGAPEHAVVCRVSDRGPGMPAEHRARAFERFWRAPGTAGDGGSGLGLAIVAELLRASGGRIELLERPGGGLTAEVELPGPA